jgi:hypothetical protein
MKNEITFQKFPKGTSPQPPTSSTLSMSSSQEYTKASQNALSNLAVRSPQDEARAINAWVLEHLPCDDKQALLERAQEFRHAVLVFKDAAQKANIHTQEDEMKL